MQSALQILQITYWPTQMKLSVPEPAHAVIMWTNSWHADWRMPIGRLPADLPPPEVSQTYHHRTDDWQTLNLVVGEHHFTIGYWCIWCWYIEYWVLSSTNFRCEGRIFFLPIACSSWVGYLILHARRQIPVNANANEEYHTHCATIVHIESLRCLKYAIYDETMTLI